MWNFEKFKGYTTDGNSDIFWPWIGIGLGCIILVVIMIVVNLGTNYLRLKGIL
jgi:hypothetical protein